MAPEPDGAAVLPDLSDQPEPAAGAAMTVRRARREIVPLEQVPVWRDLEPEHGGFGSASGDDPPAGLDALLGGLNPEQLRAVTHGDGPLMVVAGAGTGKTQVITRRIAWLVATRRARPSEILALTFTDKAAAEMQLRVDQLVPYGYTDTAISTFHAFGDRLIREHALELGLPTDVRVLSRPEVVILLREHLFELGLDEYRPLGDPTRFLDALAGLFSRCKDEDVSPATYRAYAVGLAARAKVARADLDPTDPTAVEATEALEEEARRQLELAGAYERYQAILEARGCLDFGDQVSLAIRLLRGSPSVRAEVQARFRYVLVDEFQDTNRAQAELVGLVGERHRNVTVVGDDDQAIYAFRGAAIANLLEFQARYRGARVVVLRRNYRSRAPILDAAYRLIRFNDPDRLEIRTGIPKRLRAERAAGDADPVRHRPYATGAEEADGIAAEIRRRVDEGARPRDHAILVRANADADPILRSLNLAGIAWRFAGTSGLYARPEVRLLMSFLRAIADPTSSVDVYGLAASEVYGLGGEDLTSIIAMARRRHRSAWEVLEELDRQPGILRVSQATRDAVHRLVTDLRRFIGLAHERPAGEVLYAFLRETGHLARLAAARTVEAEERLANVARFFEIVRAQSGLLADDRAAFVARHLETLVEAGDDPATADLDPDVDAVAVMTIHKAKGLEFPVVFLPGLVAGRFPSTARRDPLELPPALAPEAAATEADPHVGEERRLFYVAMTRARDELILSHAADYGGARTRRVSPFVIEALDLPAAAATPGAGTGSTPPLDRLTRFDGPAAPTPAVRTRRPDEPMVLSFYAVDAYLTCPAKYRYGHVLRVPMAPHHALVYGSALHAVVQEFHRRHARGYVMSEAELDEALERAWTNEGFVSREHEEARLATARQSLRMFREAQLVEGTRPPAYVERSFEFQLDGDRVRGRWDRVDIEPAAEDAALAAGPDVAADVAPAPVADVSAPTLELLGRERVTITDYKSSDVRDPIKARQRARDSLQLQIYAMGWEAETGRLPDAVQLHFLDSGMTGRVEVEPKRIEKARDRIRRAASGIRAGEFEATPDRMACSWCPYREICPSSAVR